jgi:hypothetical protein
MYVVVLVLGLLAVIGGLAGVGFGFTIKEFSLGGTLFITGTTAVVGGLVMIAIAGAIRELRRIAQALASRPAQAPRVPRPGELLDPYAPGAFRSGMAPTRMPPSPLPPPPYDGPPRADRPLQSRMAGEGSVPGAQSQPAEVPPVVEDADAIPLSPHEPPRAPMFAPPASGAGPEPDAAAPETDRREPAEPPEDRVRPLPFDSIWPPRQHDPHAPTDEPERGVMAERDGDAEAGARAAADEPTVPGEAAAPASDQAEAPRAVSILKSGVVDGMAYTLYSDGSIEAELPSGTLRFASINELRQHLEKTG